MIRLLALVLAFGLDLVFGDPVWLPHPVVAIGKGIQALEKGLRRLLPATPRGELAGGVVLAVVMPLLAFGAGWGLLALAGLVHPGLRFAVQVFIGYQVLATRSLAAAAQKVYTALKTGGLNAARQAVGGIVGRETAGLSETELVRATVETVAENTSDGVVAPLFFFALGGAPLALAYKAVNTMDSMVGYKNEKYLYFGRPAARLDDVCNWLPARLTALLAVVAAAVGFDAKAAFRLWRRDGKNHTSPNAGQPEAVFAGALGVQLGGDASYFGRVVQKPFLGDKTRPLSPEDIPRAVRLMMQTAVLGLLVCGVGLLAAAWITGWTTGRGWPGWL